MNDIKKAPVLFEKKEDCCGCSTCEAICPQGAIKMKPDFQGFKYPYITEEKCVGCRKCIAVCPLK